MHSSKSSSLQSSNTALSDNQLSDNQLSDNQLSDYQKATLQTMGIPLYERRAGISLFDSLNLPSEQSAGTAESPNENGANSALLTEQSAQHVVNESVTGGVSLSEDKEQESIELIDEANDFIKQVLSVLSVASTAELDFDWQVHSNDSISFKGNILITPNANILTTAAIKKQLWKTLQSRFKAQEWS